MIPQIDLKTGSRADAVQHLRRHYPGCVLFPRDYGFDMLCLVPTVMGSPHWLTATVVLRGARV